MTHHGSCCTLSIMSRLSNRGNDEEKDDEEKYVRKRQESTGGMALPQAQQTSCRCVGRKLEVDRMVDKRDKPEKPQPRLLAQQTSCGTGDHGILRRLRGGENSFRESKVEKLQRQQPFCGVCERCVHTRHTQECG